MYVLCLRGDIVLPIPLFGAVDWEHVLSKSVGCLK